MNRSQSETKTLENHAALACRLVRTQIQINPYFQWLARPAQSTPSTLCSNLNPKVIESIGNLLTPLRSDCSESEQRESQSADRWLASICQMVVRSSSTDRNGWQVQLLAAGILPLYRALATGRLREGFLQCRRRLSESLLLLGLIEPLGLDELLTVTVNDQVSPYRVLREQLQIDLTRLDFLVATTLPSHAGQENGFRSEALQILKDFKGDQKLPAEYRTPDWADPQTLWVLSNELLSSRSDFVLPRSWIDTPVPWGKIIEHWHSLELILKQSAEVATSSADASQRLNSTQALSKVGKTHSTLPNQNIEKQVPIAAQKEELRDPLESSLQEMESVDHAIREVLNDNSASANDQENERKLVPKIVIGEILGLEDPAFHNVVNRNVAVCRMEARSICLSMLLVLPDGDQNSHSRSSEQEFGLNRWQQKIVNWLADHPSLQDPIAFVTGDGQLIVTVMDIERNEMTAILRQGLVETLTGGQAASSNLCQVNIPARFHVGIASTSAPGASFNPQELILSAHRCLTVAQRLGKASIKSIEVY